MGGLSCLSTCSSPILKAIEETIVLPESVYRKTDHGPRENPRWPLTGREFLSFERCPVEGRAVVRSGHMHSRCTQAGRALGHPLQRTVTSTLPQIAGVPRHA